MTQPVQEPSQGRVNQGLEFRTRQLFRRPASMGGLIAVKLFGDDEVVTAGVRWTIGITEADQLAGMSLSAVGTYVSTVSSSGLVTMQLENLTSAVDFLSTAVSIDASEKFSDTAATPYVIDAANAGLALHDEVAFDITAAGTGAMGLLAVLRLS